MSDEGITPAGYYDGTVLEGSLETRGEDNEEIVICLKIELGSGDIVTARHRTLGEWGHLGKEVAEHLGLSWPYGLREIAKVSGTVVRVHVKHKEARSGEVYVNAYVVTKTGGGGEAVTDMAAIDPLLDKLAGKGDDNIPF